MVGRHHRRRRGGRRGHVSDRPAMRSWPTAAARPGPTTTSGRPRSPACWWAPGSPEGRGWRSSSPTASPSTSRSWPPSGRASPSSGSATGPATTRSATSSASPAPTALVTLAEHRGRPDRRAGRRAPHAGCALDHHVVVDDEGARPIAGAARRDLAGRAYGPDDLFLINSTSGTTGMPKCVLHTQNRWMYFHQLAAEAGDMTDRRRVPRARSRRRSASASGPSHVTPAMLGAPTVVHERFDADAVIAAIERERVTVLACVSTQFLMMLKSPDIERHDLSSLRCMFTGGEAVPVRAGGALRGRHRCPGAAVLRLERDRRAEPDHDPRRPRAPAPDRGPAHRRHARAPARRRRTRHHHPRHARAPGVQGAGDLPRLPRRPAAPTTSCSPPTGGCASATSAPSTPTATCGWSGARPTSSSGAARTSAPLRSRPRWPSIPAVAVAAAVAMPDEVFGERVCLYAELEPGATLDARRRWSTSSARRGCHPSGSPSGWSCSRRCPARRAARWPRVSCAPTSADDSTPVAERSAPSADVVSSRHRTA